jgi:ABC-2 type transport system ATP-binding protein
MSPHGRAGQVSAPSDRPDADDRRDDSIIVTDGLGRSFGDLQAVRDLTMSIERGKIFGFLGPNGAGKTTTIKMLCGLLPPSSGSASVAGYAVGAERERIKRHTGYMAQVFALYPDLTVEENFRFFAGAYGVYGRAVTRRMEALFEQVDLAGLRRTPAGALSGGMKQRLALACALVHEPELVFLDEPTAGVDPASRQRLWDFLYALCETGTSLFVTTHYLDEAERCHSVGFMLDGRLIARGEPAVMRERLRDRLVGVEVRRAVEAMRVLRELPGVEDVTIHGNELRVRFDDVISWPVIETRLRQAADEAGLVLDRVYPLAPTLEDLFLHFEHQGARGR